MADVVIVTDMLRGFLEEVAELSVDFRLHVA